MISVWLGDRSGWTSVRLAELDRVFVDRSSGFVDRSVGFVDRSERWVGGSERWVGGSERWVGGSELWFVDQSSFSLCVRLFCVSLLSVLLCVESGSEMN